MGMTITKRKLIELIEHLKEDDQIGFVALHFTDEGDILNHIEPYDPEHAHTADKFYLGVGDSDTIEEDSQLEVTGRG